jgi:hypothetical protein
MSATPTTVKSGNGADRDPITAASTNPVTAPNTAPPSMSGHVFVAHGVDPTGDSYRERHP